MPNLVGHMISKNTLIIEFIQEIMDVKDIMKLWNNPVSKKHNARKEDLATGEEESTSYPHPSY